MNNTPVVFEDRYHAIAYWRAALSHKDDELQHYIQLKLKEMQDIREKILWNQDELKKEILERRAQKQNPNPSLNPYPVEDNSSFALTSFSREDSYACESSLGYNQRELDEDLED